ncbi:C39 family peptidase [Bowmanella dokdonensis]|uniref:C39 family peptidase n=1 Tax=Bowmanella dokdonensis TaxID=751969 RepID=A0A939IMG2_9ALTE|nr:C39 family peptidase [Bowmanella dokdonensis]MBN7825283.1 C39 family peptidase [Bowmanella dokdonensis]
MKNIVSTGLLAACLLSAKALALCPDGSSFDNQLGFCADGTNAYGPFTQAMTNQCNQAGGGSACTSTFAVQVQGQSVSLARWSEGFTASLRGSADCPNGTVRSPTYGGHCFEQASSGPNNVYGNFTSEEVTACQQLSGGNACLTTRWSANFYLSVKAQLEQGSEPVNRFGAWLWYIDEPGVNKTHTQLADELAAMGVKRVFIKIADGTNNCGLFSDVCSTQTANTYRSRGIEPWAWSYNYPGNETAQADALFYAAQYGYVGFVLDVEVEFNNTSTALHSLFQAFQVARNDAIAAGYADAGFKIGATTWSNPIDQGMNVGIIDQYVDFHMPQTYLEVWGAPYMAAAKTWIEAGSCEYRQLGANKPIWHIVSTEYDDITSAQLTAFMDAAGPNASIWRVPGGSVPQAVWQDWQALNWQKQSFDQQVACHGSSNDMLAFMANTPTEPEPPAQSVPYYSQLENSYQPHATCSVTSLAMITDFFGITDPSVLGKRTPDYLYERFGLLQDVPSLAGGFNQLAQEAGSTVRDTGWTNGTLAQLRDLAAQGKPTIVHGWFTNPGHILVVTGFDGDYYTVQDPYGKWNLQKWGSYDTSVSGKNQKYPKAAFEYAINDNGTGDDLWLHVFE